MNATDTAIMKKKLSILFCRFPRFEWIVDYLR